MTKEVSMGNLFKGVYLLTQSEYNTLSANEQLDPDVLYATPENVTELVRLHTEQISENSANIALNKEDIESLKNSPGGSSEDIVEIKNTINEIILRDNTQDNRLLNIEEKFATDVVDLASTQTITGPKTFTEHIYLANADGTVDRISHLNNNFIIHSGATNSAVLNIDEGLEKIYAFNNELAFKSDIAEAANKDLSNVTYPQVIANGVTQTGAGDRIVERWVSSDGNTWYEKYESGWKKCGGKVYTSQDEELRTITFPLQFTAIPSVYTNFIYRATYQAQYQFLCARSITTTNFKTMLTSDNSDGTTWHALGY